MGGSPLSVMLVVLVVLEASQEADSVTVEIAVMVTVVISEPLVSNSRLSSTECTGFSPVEKLSLVVVSVAVAVVVSVRVSVEKLSLVFVSVAV
jgi:phosphatidylserine synthase